MGHEVCVLTGYPNYPEGILYEGYGRGKHIDERVNGVTVHRSFTIPRGTSTLQRILNYYSYPFFSTRFARSKKCHSSDGGEFDVVLCCQLSPIIMVNAGVAYAKKHNVPVVFYTFDLWPESLLAGGFKSGSLLYRYLHRISDRLYNSTDKILITSRTFRPYLIEEFGVDDARISYLPQFAENLFKPSKAKEETGVFDFMFAGNIGAAQSLDTILGAAEQLKDYPVRFHIVGSGSELERLQQCKEEKHLDNVIFHGRKPLEEMPRMYAMADAMLVTLCKRGFLNRTLPGKVQTYMAAGKPIIGAVDGETASVIQDARCGFCGEAENAGQLKDNILGFISCDDRKQLGINAAEYYNKYFTRESFLKTLAAQLQAAISQHKR